MIMVKLSVIIPVYNLESDIEICYQSIKKQTFQNWELIMVNDGSIDHSKEILDKIATTDSRVRVVTTPNYGVSHARNIGLDKAQGPYILFIDGDDVIEENYFQEMLSTIIKTSSDIVFTSHYYKDNIKLPTTLLNFKEIDTQHLLKYHLKFQFISSLCFCIFNRKILSHIRLAESIKTLEDWEFLFQVIQKSTKISCCEGAFYHYITRYGSSSKSKLNSNKLTALNLIHEVDKKLENKDFYMDDLEVLNLRIVLHLMPIVATVGVEKKEYLKQLVDVVKQDFKRGLMSKSLQKKQKLYLILIRIHPRLFSVLYFLKNYRRLNHGKEK